MLWNNTAGQRRAPLLGLAASRASAFFACLLVLGMLDVGAVAPLAYAAPSAATLEKMLATEQKKAAERSASLQIARRVEEFCALLGQVACVLTSEEHLGKDVQNLPSEVL